jgi:hypothetical protein
MNAIKQTNNISRPKGILFMIVPEFEVQIAKELSDAQAKVIAPKTG